MSDPHIKQLIFKQLEEIVPSAIGMLSAADNGEISAVFGLVRSLVTAIGEEVTHRGFNASAAIAASDAADKLAMHLQFHPNPLE